MPITLNEVRSGYSLAIINDNFQQIQNKWDEKLDRLVSTQGNQMSQSLDLNGNSVLNATFAGVTTEEIAQATADANTAAAAANNAADKAIASPINNGIWAAGVVFSAYNQFMVFSGVAYKPKITTTLPYTSTSTPDTNFVEPFSEITSKNVGDFSGLVFTNIANLKTGTLVGGQTITMTSLPVGTCVSWQGYTSPVDGGGNWGTIKTGAHTEDGISIFSLGATTYVEADFAGGVVNVKKGGATGDGTTDDFTALTRAITYAESSGIKNIEFPAGTYRVSGQLTWNDKTHWKGYGRSTVIKPLPALTGQAVIKNTQVINALWSGYQSIKDISIINTGVGITSTRGLEVEGAVWEWELDNVYIEGFGQAGLFLDRCYRGIVNNLGIYSCGQTGSEAPLTLTSTLANDRCSNIYFIGGNIQDTAANLYAARWIGAVGCQMETTVFQSNGRGIEFSGCSDCVLDNVYMEDLDREIFMTQNSGVNNKRIRFNNVIFASATYALAILLEGDEDTVFDHVNASGTNIAYITRSANSVRSRIYNSNTLQYSGIGTLDNQAVVADDDFYGRTLNSQIWDSAGTVTLVNQNGGVVRAQSVATNGAEAGITEGLYPLIYADENPVVEVKAKLNSLTNVLYRPISLESTTNFIRVYANNSGAATNYVLSVSNGVGTTEVTTGSLSTTSWTTFRIISVASKVQLEVNGVTVAEVTSNIPTIPLQLRSYLVNGEAVNKNFDIDYVYAVKDRTRPAV